MNVSDYYILVATAFEGSVNDYHKKVLTTSVANVTS